MDPNVYARLPWWKKLFVLKDKLNERMYGYHGPSKSPEGITEPLWLESALYPGNDPPAKRALHYAQCQYDIPKSGSVECVTTSVVIARNIIKDHLANKQGLPPGVDFLAKSFTADLDRSGFSGWKYRLPSCLPIVGGFMHPTVQLPKLLDWFAKELMEQYQCSFSYQFTSHNTPDDLIRNLQNNHITLIHGIWEGYFVNPGNGKFKYDIAVALGGFPHTMPLAMYSGADEWWFYDLGWKPNKPGNGFYKMSTPQLMKFWGRHYLFNTYTRPFSMTTIRPEP